MDKQLDSLSPPESKIKKKSIDIIQKKLGEIRTIIPECFSEGKIDHDKFRKLYDDVINTNDEKYTLNWAGRNDTFRNIQTPSTGTLVADKKESINFDDTENIFIKGENLEVLKLLQKSYFGKVKMIYIDPPYNTGKDFIYKDNFHENIADYLEQTGQSKDGIKLTTNSETSGRYHSDWISFMYARLFVARNLLSDDGVIFVSIDDHEVHNLRIIMNEIFGEENFRNTIVVRRYDKNLNRQFFEKGLSSFNTGFEYVIIYSKNMDTKLKPIFRKSNKKRSTKGYWKGFWNSADRPTMRYELFGIIPKTGQWKWSKELSYEAISNYEEYLDNFSMKTTLEEYWESTGRSKKFLRHNLAGKGKNQGVEHWIPPITDILRNTLWQDIFASKSISNLGLKFDNPKNHEMIKELISMCADNNIIVMDFFAGSGTTAHAVMELNKEDGGNRKFITVQIPEKNESDTSNEYPTIAEICKERIRRAIKQMDNKNLGFKVFKLTKSNYKIWNNVKEPDKLKDQIKLFESPLVKNYKDINVIYECIIKEGYSLNSKIEKLTKSNIIYKIIDDENIFYICLDKSISDKIIEETQITTDDVLICIDAALDDSQKTNLSKQCDLRTL